MKHRVKFLRDKYLVSRFFSFIIWLIFVEMLWSPSCEVVLNYCSKCRMILIIRVSKYLANRAGSQKNNWLHKNSYWNVEMRLAIVYRLFSLSPQKTTFLTFCGNHFNMPWWRPARLSTWCIHWQTERACHSNPDPVSVRSNVKKSRIGRE